MTHTQTTCPNRIALRAGKKGAHPDEVGALVSVFEKKMRSYLSKTFSTKYLFRNLGFNIYKNRIWH